MEEIIVGNVEELCDKVKGKMVYIYGAKSVALRVWKTLELSKNGGTEVVGFLVSNRYDNPKKLYGKNVYRIEEENKHFDCVILAVNGGILWHVRDEIEQYDIDRLILISPLMDDMFEKTANSVLNKNCKISDKAYIDNNVQIVADETSIIEIDDNVIIGEKTILIAVEHSHIHIGERSCIGCSVKIIAENGSFVNLYERTSIGENSELLAKKDSVIRLSRECSIGKKISISSQNTSIIQISNICVVGDYGKIGLNKGRILIGEGTTFGTNLYLVCEYSDVIIGKECMFSVYVKINVGSHQIIDKSTEENITNRNAIRIGNHVWCGMGCIILPGCDVGDGCIVGAASVVNKVILPDCTCAGSPIRILRKNIEWKR